MACAILKAMADFVYSEAFKKQKELANPVVDVRYCPPKLTIEMIQERLRLQEPMRRQAQIQAEVHAQKTTQIQTESKINEEVQKQHHIEEKKASFGRRLLGFVSLKTEKVITKLAWTERATRKARTIKRRRVMKRFNRNKDVLMCRDITDSAVAKGDNP